MTYRYRSFFWPALLVLAGIIALLANTGLISADRVAGLWNLWPVILILIGLELVIRRTVQGRSGEIAVALVALLAVAGAVAYVAVAPSPGATQVLDLTDSLGNIDHAAVEIDVGAATITMAGGDSLSGDLYRAHIEFSGPKPSVTLDRSTGKVRIKQSSSRVDLFQSRRFVMTLELNSSIPWTITSNTGAVTETLNLSGVHVGSVEINTGASKEDLTLGQPSGIVPITLNGGALTVNLHRPSGTEASVAVSGGAVSLNADGRQTHAIGNLSFETSGFGGAANGYRLQVNGGACNVSIDTSASSS
ncbi:MAG TPA: DUF5668 domain-containing protein [Candidatus Dormibacteraeota bacterium]|nr:DUF5668 domain-containing protein [Candidatus Dormibacteraeota bacterium]